MVAKKTAAKKTAATRKPREATPQVLDLDNLVAEDVDEPIRHSRVDFGPVLGWLKESYENEQGKSVKNLTDDGVKQLESLLRGAATQLGVGVKIVKSKQDDGTTTVKFLGKEKRAYNPSDE